MRKKLWRRLACGVAIWGLVATPVLAAGQQKDADLPTLPTKAEKDASGEPKSLPVAAAQPTEPPKASTELQAPSVSTPSATAPGDSSQGITISEPSESVMLPEIDDCSTCIDECDTCCEPCCICPPGRIWIRGEALLWWLDGAQAPPLLTTNTLGGQPILGDPGTRILFGGDELESDLNVGGRFQIGGWLDECQRVGLQGGVFFLSSDGDDFSAASSGNPVLGRPFFDVLANAQNVQVLADANFQGSINIDNDINLLGADGALRTNLVCKSSGTCDPCGSDCWSVPSLNCCRIDLINGFRFLYLNDSLATNEDIVTPNGAGAIAAGTRFLVNDSFEATNRFYGYDFGASTSVYKGRWSFELLTKIAFGGMNRQVDIDGSTQISVPGQATTNNVGGLLTQASNIGRHEDTEIAIVPELGLNFGYQITRCIRLRAGYTFLYATNVARAAEHIDTNVNVNQINNPAVVQPLAPAFQFNDSDFWAHGVNLGAEVRF